MTLIMIYDADGMTPTRRSEMLAKFWNKGKITAYERRGISLLVTPMGRINMDSEKCIGCMTCIDVCPKNVYEYNELTNKVSIARADGCVNCRACLNRCPVGAPYPEPETEAAKKAFEIYMNLSKYNG